MRRASFALVGVVLLAMAGFFGWQWWIRETPPPVEWSDDLQVVADGSNRFALDLYGKLSENKQGNIFFSPYSIHTALTMTAIGARGKTRDQMVSVLHLPPGDDKMLASGDIARYYAHPRRDFELSVANSLWGHKDYGWRQEFLDAQTQRFGTALQHADFKANPEAERLRINEWVEEKTRKRIKELLIPRQITPRTTMVLVNAVYFKGKWATQFDPRRTHDATFHCSDDTRVRVPMMHAEMNCGYAQRDGIAMVELPYKGGELSMVVILPRLPDGLPALEKQLTPEILASWLGELRDRGKLQVSIPKFKIETRYELRDHLKALGMVDAFGAADFTGMAPGSTEPVVFVSHKAFIEVDEEGTKAAAATAVGRATSTYPPPFYADHPFLFLIRDVKHGTILFMGRVEKP
jgi:serine protease inhibitor